MPVLQCVIKKICNSCLPFSPGVSSVPSGCWGRTESHHPWEWQVLLVSTLLSKTCRVRFCLCFSGCHSQLLLHEDPANLGNKIICRLTSYSCLGFLTSPRGPLPVFSRMMWGNTLLSCREWVKKFSASLTCGFSALAGAKNQLAWFAYGADN